MIQIPKTHEGVVAGNILRQVNILVCRCRCFKSPDAAWFALINETHVWLRAVHGITVVRRGLRLALFVWEPKRAEKHTKEKEKVWDCWNCF